MGLFSLHEAKASNGNNNKKEKKKEKKTIYMQIKPYHLNLFVPLPSAKVLPFAQRLSITASCGSTLHLHNFYLEPGTPMHIYCAAIVFCGTARPHRERVS